MACTRMQLRECAHRSLGNPHFKWSLQTVPWSLFQLVHSDCCKVERDRKIARTPNHKEPCTARLQRCSLGTEREPLGLHNRAGLQSRPFSGKLRWWLHAANLPLTHCSSRSLLLPVVDKGEDGSSTRRRSVHPRYHPLPVLVLQWSVWYSGSELII